MNRKKTLHPQRYYDIRLVLMYICLMAFYVGLNGIVSLTLNTPLMAEWVEGRPGAWSLSSEIEGLLSLRVSLWFFELGFGCLIASLLCGGEEETQGNHVFEWVCLLMGLPVIVNFVSSLWIWIIYSLIMILWGWRLGKKTGFVLPIDLKEIFQSAKDELHNLEVPHYRLGHLKFRGYSGIIIISAGLIIPLGVAVYYYISALLF